MNENEIIIDNIDIDEMPNQMDLDFQINDVDFAITDEDDGLNDRYQKASIYKKTLQRNVKYDNAVKLAKEIELNKGDRYNAIISGGFIFGDFLEAFCVEKNLLVREMTISTLSLSQDNIDSLYNLIAGDYVQKLNIIISHYFYSHERRGLIAYLYKRLDIDDKLQLAVAGTHTKITTMLTDDLNIVVHGSANLRSSANVEQFCIEENEGLYEFYDDFHKKILEKYATINKPLRVKPLWDLITKN